MAHSYTAAEVYTLAELAQFYEDDSRLSSLVNTLAKDDPILDHIVWKEGNQTDGHKHKIVTSLPDVDFRRMYQGVSRSKAGVASVRETTRQIASRWEIDADELRLYEGLASQNAFRLQEGALHLQAMREFCVNQLFYGNSDTNPDEIRGLAARYAYKDAPNVVDAGGTTGNQCSIWGVVWGATEVFGFYPKNMKAGIQHRILNGDVPFDAYDENGNPFEAVGDEWKWNIGFAVRDWRAVTRVCNITVANLNITDPDDADYIDLMTLTIDAKNKVPRQLRNRIKWYVPNAIMSALEKQARSAKNLYLNYGEWQNSSEVLKLHGYPVFECDSLLETETALTAMP